MSNITDLAVLIGGLADMTWLRSAACGELGVEQLDQFFVEAGSSLSKEVKSMCAKCPVRAECLTHAVRREVGGGYFAGTSPTKRRNLTLDELLAAL